MLACPSRLEISRWEASPETERPVELADHVAACPRCSALMAEIGEARSLLLGSDPAEASTRAARAILECVRERRHSRRWWRLLVPALLVPAVAALLVIGKPALLGLNATGHSAQAIKGELLVEIFCKRGDAIFPAMDGGDYLEGDRLRFAYSKERPGYLLVFGVDDSGTVFPYYDEHALVGVHAEAGGRVLLPDSVELDGHKGWERIFVLWSETQFADDAMRSAVSRTLSGVDNDVRRMTTLDLPVAQVSMLLRRP
jgi:hypothetical protein